MSSPPTTDEGRRDPFEGRVDGLYLVLISLHGLVRGERMELGRDPDTGGQVCASFPTSCLGSHRGASLSAMRVPEPVADRLCASAQAICMRFAACVVTDDKAH